MSHHWLNYCSHCFISHNSTIVFQILYPYHVNYVLLDKNDDVSIFEPLHIFYEVLIIHFIQHYGIFKELMPLILSCSWSNYMFLVNLFFLSYFLQILWCQFLYFSFISLIEFSFSLDLVFLISSFSFVACEMVTNIFSLDLLR